MKRHISRMKTNSSQDKQFLEITGQYKDVIAKVCYMYVSPVASFDDLLQEVLINIWQGLESFRGEAKISTWIYRTAINTCITWHRRNSKYSAMSITRIDDLATEPADSSTAAIEKEQWHELQMLISRLGVLDKALITLWLDERPYDEIALITGLSQSNVAVRIHRIKAKLSQMANS